MIEVSWDKFNQKFHGREQSVFEEVCYHIFCTITKNIQGIFRYKNHPGIETNDVLYQEKHTGFQAKYFLDDLSGHKDDFLDAISKTRKHNTRVLQQIAVLIPRFDVETIRIRIDTEAARLDVQRTRAADRQHGIRIGLAAFERTDGLPLRRIVVRARNRTQIAMDMACQPHVQLRDRIRPFEIRIRHLLQNKRDGHASVIMRIGRAMADDDAALCTCPFFVRHRGGQPFRLLLPEQLVHVPLAVRMAGRLRWFVLP